jgi:hypothetical protein
MDVTCSIMALPLYHWESGPSTYWLGGWVVWTWMQGEISDSVWNQTLVVQPTAIHWVDRATLTPKFS